MKRNPAIIIIALALSCLAADTPPRFTPDLNSIVEQGDEAFVIAKRPIIPKPGDYPVVAKSFFARDIEGLQGMTKAGMIVWTDGPVRVRVLDVNGHVDPAMIEVRVLDGESRGKVGYCLNGSVFLPATTRRSRGAQANQTQRRYQDVYLNEIRSCLTLFQQIVPKMDLPEAKEAPKPKSVADRLMIAAKDCSEEGDTAGALEIYRLVIREYRGSPQAAEASARLRERP